MFLSVVDGYRSLSQSNGVISLVKTDNDQRLIVLEEARRGQPTLKVLSYSGNLVREQDIKPSQFRETYHINESQSQTIDAERIAALLEFKQTSQGKQYFQNDAILWSEEALRAIKIKPSNLEQDVLVTISAANEKLLRAAETGVCRDIGYALDMGADINCRQSMLSFGFASATMTPLMLAVKHGHKNAVLYLLDKGADYQKSSFQQWDVKGYCPGNRDDIRQIFVELERQQQPQSPSVASQAFGLVKQYMPPPAKALATVAAGALSFAWWTGKAASKQTSEPPKSSL